MLADARVNADGTLDFTRWSRPQADGPALRCLALLRWLREFPDAGCGAHAAAAPSSIGGDLAFTLSHAQKPCFDIWEEESGYHYYTQLVQAEALARGAAWLAMRALTQRPRPGLPRSQRRDHRLRLDALWDEAAGFYRSRAEPRHGDRARRSISPSSSRMLHAGRASGAHSVLDPRAQATLSALEELFEANTPSIATARKGGPAMGRYANDRLLQRRQPIFLRLWRRRNSISGWRAALRGGAKLAVTEENSGFRQRLGIARQPAESSRGGGRALQRGDAFMQTVRAFTPAGGELSEQFDRTTGAETSARHLAWSYAAFITAAASRAQARRSTPASVPSTPPAGTA